MNRNRFLARTTWLLALLMMSSCGGSEQDAELIEAQRREALRYYEGPPQENADPLQLDSLATDVPFFIIDECNQLYSAACGAQNTVGEENQCGWITCTLNKMLCKANKMLEIADSTNTVKFKEWEMLEDDRIWVPVQLPPVRLALRKAVLRELALRLDMETAIKAVDTSTDCTGEFTVETDEGDKTITALQEVEQLLGFAFERAITTLDRVAEDYVAEADRRLADSFDDNAGDLVGIPEEEFDAAKLKRMTAASFLGGALDPETDTELDQRPRIYRRDAGLCTAPTLSDAGLAARLLIREAGIHPDLLDAIPLTESDSGVDIGPVVDEVQNRIEVQWLRSWASRPDFLLEQGLRLEDFAEARRYMVDEIRAFGRSRTKVLDILPGCSDDTSIDPANTTECERYATTVNPAVEAPWLHYASFAVFNPDSGNGHKTAVGASGQPDPDQYPTHTKVALVVRNLANALLNDLQGDPLDADSYARIAEAEEIGTRLQNAIAEELDGAVVMKQAGGVVGVFVGSQRYDPNEMVAVTSVEALSCATRGEIEGTACTWVDDVDPGLPNRVQINPGDSITFGGLPLGTCEAFEVEGFATANDEIINLGPRCTRFEIAEASTPDRVFILRRRIGAPKHSPGSYEGFAVEWPIATDSTSVPYTLSYVTPRMQRRAAEILTPASSWCAQPKWNCAGTEFDARLPLEDELIDDGDAFESSWRNYLIKARRAAEEADFVGREAASAAFQISKITEDAIAEVEDLCGMRVPIELITEEYRKLEENYDPASGGPAPTLAAAVEELKSPSDIGRLKQCLGASDLVDFVALGSETLCGWYYGSTDNDADRDTSTFCRLDNGDVTADNLKLGCPVVADDCDIPNGYNKVIIDADDFTRTGGGDTDTSDLLGLFADSEFGGPGGDGTIDTGSCEAIRSFRDNLNAGIWSAAHDDWGDVFKDNRFWETAPVANVAAPVVWKFKPGDFSTLYVNGSAAITTGDIEGKGIATSGVCAAAGSSPPETLFSCQTTHDSSPFCGYVDCDNPTERYAYNYRLGRAAVVARWLGGLNLDGFQVPFSGARPEPSQSPDITDLHPDVIPWFGAAQLGKAAGKDPHKSTFYCTGDYTGATPPAQTIPGFPGPTAGLFHYYDEGTWEYTPAICGVDATAIKVDDRVIDRKDRYITYRYNGFARLAGPDRAWGHRKVNTIDEVETKQDANELLAKLRTNGVSSDWPDYLTREQQRRLPWTLASDPVGRDGNSPFGVYQPGVAFFMPHHRKIDPEALLDGLELICEASLHRSNAHDAELDELATEIGTMNEFERENLDPTQVRGLIERGILRLEAFSDRVVFQNLPREVTDAIQGQTNGLAGATGGQYGQEVARIRAALIEMRDVPRQLGFELRGFNRANARYDNEIKRAAIKDELARNQFQRTRARELSACAVAIADAVAATSGITNKFKPALHLGAIAKTAAVCGNSARQIQLAAQALDLERELNDIDEAQAGLNFGDQSDQHFVNMEALADRLEIAISDLNAALLSLESLRDRTTRALRRAIFLDSDQTKGMLASNVVLRNQFGHARTRYWRARRDAIRMAFLARRAIEQRFGVYLSSIKKDMTLVEAPRTWVGELCSYDGIDYSVRKSEELGQDIDLSVKHFSDGYVGEYVTRLENFVESYRLDFPFQNGEDTAVVSLRDDIHRVRAKCAVNVPNELAYSSRLDVLEEEGGLGWRTYQCVDPQPNCVSVASLDDELYPFAATRPLEGNSYSLEHDEFEFGAPLAYRMTFGPTHPICGADLNDADCPCDSTFCGWTPLARYGQDISLNSGTYRLSWYERVDGGGTTQNPPLIRFERPAPAQQPDAQWDLVWEPSAVATCEADVNGDLVDFHPQFRADGTVERNQSGAPIDVFGNPDPDLSCANHPGGWTRMWAELTSTKPQDVRLAISPPVDGFGSHAQGAQVDIAGIMLEPLGSQSGVGAPAEYYATDGQLQSKVELCEDTDGSVFRSRGWRRSCVRLCDDGFGYSCSEEQSALYCYRETDFVITNRAIQRNEQFALSGFARGNFNYRVDSVGVNFVGSGARDCSDTSFGSTCYSAGWIPYTLRHSGPHRVQNHGGGTYRALLVPGVIEHARGLATQRYLTNPLSGADSQQIGQFMQGQYRGRPLTGSYTLRIWEEPGVNFDGIEDVQVLLNYRFWTRQE